jgi:hypothetical protein
MLTRRMQVQYIADRMAGLPVEVDARLFTQPWLACWNAISTSTPGHEHEALYQATLNLPDQKEILQTILGTRPGYVPDIKSLQEIGAELPPIDWIWKGWIPRGGRSVLFRLELMDYRPILLLVEGEWDAMLVWDHCADLCDVATLGGAQSRFDTLDLALLIRYTRVLVVHDDDRAGEQGRAYITGLQTIIPRIRPVLPPAHDLTDFRQAGGDVRSWTANHMSAALEEALSGMKTIRPHLARYRYVLSLATQK